MIKILSVFGTRPEAIKMAPIVKELAKHDEVFVSKVCVTGQHREMLDQVLALFNVTPDFDLDVMRPGQSLNGIMAAILRSLDRVIEAERPDWVLVQGDTTTALAGGIAAMHRQVRVGHVEAGLRTHDKRRPFPEEHNRRLVAVTADVHFAPTNWAAGNLRREGVPEEEIVVTGNTVIDALRRVANRPFDPRGTALQDLPYGYKRLIVATAHRRESHGRGMEEICHGLRMIARRHDDVHIVYPVHLNPRVQEPVRRILGDVPNVTLLPPLDYLPLVWLLNQSYFVITDSGGIQEEAPGLGKPVLVLRETTERPEGVEAGTVRLVGADRRRIAEAASELLENPIAYDWMARAVNPYGDGHAAERIVDELRQRTVSPAGVPARGTDRLVPVGEPAAWMSVS